VGTKMKQCEKCGAITLAEKREWHTMSVRQTKSLLSHIRDDMDLSIDDNGNLCIWDHERKILAGFISFSQGRIFWTGHEDMKDYVR